MAGLCKMEFSQPIFTDEQIADADWSDAGFFGFLESLSDRDAPAEKVLPGFRHPQEEVTSS